MTKKSLPKKQTGGVSPKKNLSGAAKPIAGRTSKIPKEQVALDKWGRDQNGTAVSTKKGNAGSSMASTEGFKARTQGRPGNNIRNPKHVLKKK